MPSLIANYVLNVRVSLNRLNDAFFLVELISAQANNQWKIGAALGSDPMESAFALTLTSGIKGVAMVLDREVQPLTSDSTKCGACQEAKGMDLSSSHVSSIS